MTMESMVKIATNLFDDLKDLTEGDQLTMLAVMQVVSTMMNLEAARQSTPPAE